MQTAVVQNFGLNIAAPELSRVLRLDEITATANTTVIDATPHECMELAARLDLPYIRHISAEITYRRIRSGQMIRLEGRISSTFGQLCANSLSPMPMVIEEEFHTEYTLAPWEKFSEFDLDSPEILTDDFIDLGEITTQYFSLTIDPYARRAGQETLVTLTESLVDTIREFTAQIAEEEPTSVTENVSAVVPPPAPIPEDPTLPAPVNTQSESLFFKYLRKIREN